MEATILHLFKADDAESAFAIRLPQDLTFRAVKGFGQQFTHVWTLEVQSSESPDLSKVIWDKVLDRAIEAYEMSDPVLTNFDWADSENPPVV